MYALSIRGLTKTYKNGVQALRGIDLDVEQGDFFALLGPNGAGKTTLIGILTSLVNKTAGTVNVFGHDIEQHPSFHQHYDEHVHHNKSAAHDHKHDDEHDGHKLHNDNDHVQHRARRRLDHHDNLACLRPGGSAEVLPDPCQNGLHLH